MTGTITLLLFLLLLLLLLLLIDRLSKLIDSVLNFLSESGALTFSFNLYFASSGALVTTDYTIDLETQLYGMLYVEGYGFSSLDVHFEALRATSSEGYSEELISNG